MTTATSRSSWIKPAAFVAILALGIGSYFSLNNQPSAPDVVFHSIKGDKISLAQLRGKVFLVNFWATSCTTCVKEMPQLVATYNKYKGQGLELVAVAMKDDPPNYVLNFTETRQLPFTVALDITGEAAKAYGNVVMTPTTFLVDKDGKIIKRYLGEPDFPALHKLLEKKLAG